MHHIGIELFIPAIWKKVQIRPLIGSCPICAQHAIYIF